MLEDLGRVIRQLRQRRRLTLAEFGKRCGLSGTYIAAIERGNKSNFRFSTISKIAEALDLPLPILLIMASTDDELDELQRFVPNIKATFMNCWYYEKVRDMVRM